MSSHEPILPARPLVLAPVRSLATAATVLVVAYCVAGIFDVWADWNRFSVASDYVAGVPGVGIADLVSADNMSASAIWLGVIANLVAGVVFLVWLWRARRNAELINSAQHRLRRGWAIGGWFCPVVNLWFPRFIVDDVWRASRPGVPNDLYSIQGLEHSGLVRSWWYAWLGNWLASLWLLGELRAEVSVPMLRDVATANTVGTVLLLISGALVVPVIRQITQWQSIPREQREDWRRA